jgi:hypothetical protein
VRVVVVDLVVFVGSVAGVELVVVVVDLVAFGLRYELVVVDLVTSGLGFVLVAVVVDLVTSSAALRASSIIVAIRMATNIFFISKPLSLVICMNHVCTPKHIHNVFGGNNTNPKFQAVIARSGMSLQI